MTMRHFLLNKLAEFKTNDRDFPGGPVVKTSPSNAGGAGSIPGQKLRSHMPCGQKKRKKTQKTKKYRAEAML